MRRQVLSGFDMSFPPFGGLEILGLVFAALFFPRRSSPDSIKSWRSRLWRPESSTKHVALARRYHQIEF